MTIQNFLEDIETDKPWGFKPNEQGYFMANDSNVALLAAFEMTITNKVYYVGFGVKTPEQIKDELCRLTELWREERKYMSNPKEIFSCPAYLKILSHKESALSFILSDLKENQNEPDNWFDALKKLTGEKNVVDKAHFGNRKLMAKDWLAWATQNGRV